MSLLVYQVHAAGCFMISDTLTILREEGDNEPQAVSVSAKVQVIAHKEAMTSGTGVSAVIEGWFRHAAQLSPALNVDELAAEAESFLPEIARRLFPGEDCRTMVNLIGHSPAKGTFVGYRFKSGDGFCREEITPGVVWFCPDYSQPGDDLPEISTLDDVMERIVLIKDREPALMPGHSFRVGGQIVHHWMTMGEDGFAETTCKLRGQFKDFPNDLRAIFARGLGSSDLCETADRIERLMSVSFHRLARRAILHRLNSPQGEAA